MIPQPHISRRRSNYVRSAHLGALVAVVAFAGWSEPSAAQPQNRAASSPWNNLLDRKSLRHWQVVEKYDFRKHAKVNVSEDQIVLPAGSPGTAVRWSDEFPRIEYEVTLEARRVDGDDFFCGMTFPVGQKALTLVVGGWGGQVTGLSSIDDEPAVENETCSYVEYEQGRWYAIRLKVTKPKIEVWLDKEKIIDLETADRKLSIYWEVEPCLPFGIATWRTTGALRNLRVRSVVDESSTKAE